MAFRDGPFENLKVPLAWTAAVMVVGGIVAAVMLLLADRPQPAADDLEPARAAFDSAAGTTGGVLAAPVRWGGDAVDYVKGYFFAVSENRRLRRELAEMSAWRDDALALKNLNARYEQLLGLQTEPPIAMTAGRAITDARAPVRPVAPAERRRGQGRARGQSGAERARPGRPASRAFLAHTAAWCC